MTHRLIRVRARLAGLVAGIGRPHSRERGQGTLEYVGMIALAALLVVAIVTQGVITSVVTDLETLPLGRFQLPGTGCTGVGGSDARRLADANGA